MTVSELLKCLEIKKVHGPADRVVRGIEYDSRRVEEGVVFVAVKGYSTDGHKYIKDALNRGAAAIVAEDAVAIAHARNTAVKDRTAYIEVSDSREALALISSAYYGHPAEKLSLIGITGTNGKTTTAFITRNIIEAGGGSAGLLGTICYMTGATTRSAVNTTPESLDLQRYLNEMVENGMTYGVLEVSSHALALRRVDGCTFSAAAFLNFSQDHLDFHGTMDDYFEAKKKIFSYLGPGGTAVLNRDDPMTGRLAGSLDCDVLTCGIEDGAMIRAEHISERGESLSTGLSFSIRTPRSTFPVRSDLIGRFNIHNILMAAGTAYSLGFSDEAIQEGIRTSRPVAGRFEQVDEGQDFLCVVDYAHTEDALRNIVREARAATRGRVITVFGCGGDRDRNKRPLMGAAASELSDFVIVTSDNPRGEDPMDIIRDITPGIPGRDYTVNPDRESAIMEAVSMARSEDTVVVAGKGHEDYQEVRGVRHHFSDREILSKALKKRLSL